MTVSVLLFFRFEKSFIFKHISAEKKGMLMAVRRFIMT